jgi:hypothetical protein
MFLPYPETSRCFLPLRKVHTSGSFVNRRDRHIGKRNAAFLPLPEPSQAGGSRLLRAFSSLLCAPSLNLYGTLAL